MPLHGLLMTPTITAGCVNFSFAYVEGESLLMAMKDVALSSGRSVSYLLPHTPILSLPPPCYSACTSASLEPSYVLRAVGADEDLAHSSIRFGIGRFTTEEEVDYTVNKCVSSVTQLREMRSVNVLHVVSHLPHCTLYTVHCMRW